MTQKCHTDCVTLPTQHNVHHHHAMEEDYVIPGLRELNLVLPPKLTSDHKQLLQDMEDLTTLIQALPKEGGDASVLKPLQAKWEQAKATMIEHLAEEVLAYSPIPSTKPFTDVPLTCYRRTSVWP